VPELPEPEPCPILLQYDYSKLGIFDIYQVYPPCPRPTLDNITLPRKTRLPDPAALDRPNRPSCTRSARVDLVSGSKLALFSKTT
jgi:hypothetical protein